MKYRPEVDGLRALAVVPVILFHAGIESFSGGFVGVDVFFVISGYLITTIILSDLERGSFSLINFYERRARRILPALFLVMLCCLPFAWFLLLPPDLKDFGESLSAVAAFVSNILFWRESDYFATATELKPLLHTWSLAIEEQFYVIFPLTLLAIWKWARGWLAFAVICVLVSSLSIAHYGAYAAPTANFFLLPSRAWELAIGALVAQFLFDNRNATRVYSISRALREILSLTGLVLVFYSIFLFDEITPFPSLYALVPVLGTALVIIFASEQTATGQLLSGRLVVGIGLISYSAYLWHQPLLAFSRYAIPSVNDIILLALCGASLVLAWVSWRFVERPFRDKSVFGRRTIFAFAAAGSIGFFVLGATTHVTDGFIGRYDPKLHSLLKIDHNPRYVPIIGSRLINQDFEDDGRIKVLVVGDSYAEDLINGIYEGGLNQELQISFHKIPSVCGNLYLDEYEFSENIEPRQLSNCQSIGWYGGQDLRRRLDRADSIWLVSSWADWQVELVPRSVDKLISEFGDKVFVFGTKHFGKIDLKEIVAAASNSGLTQYYGRPAEEKLGVNERMKSNLDNQHFVDLIDLLCGADLNCPVVDENGKLISFDGGHLTREGAIYFGRLLQRHPLVRSVIEAN